MSETNTQVVLRYFDACNIGDLDELMATMDGKELARVAISGSVPRGARRANHRPTWPQSRRA